MTTSWKQEYEQWLVNQALEQSQEGLSPLSAEQFEKYVEYIAMMTNLEDTNSDLLATNQIYHNYNHSAQILSDEMKTARDSFYALAKKQESALTVLHSQEN